MEAFLNPEYFNRLYDYNYWAHRRVWDCVMELNPEEFETDLDYSIGSIRTQVIHTMGVEHWWITFLSEGILSFLDIEDYPNRTVIRDKWDEIEAYVRGYIQSLTPAELDREVKPPFWEDHERPVKVWEALLQVANHSTDHRAQTLAGLHRLGAPTVGQDSLDYISDETALCNS
ncbi:MAG: hypothetical protein F9K46_19110 [Anaerolineae bacterium]|nr:MAG: hypothetical protein F9K46_19110 [Anaerolineae bacterium]